VNEARGGGSFPRETGGEAAGELGSCNPMRAGSGGGSVPVYLPEELKDELPMFRRFKVKLLGEVDIREDQGESSGCAVKVVALGRVLT
jgi:hypothetical protein